MLDEEEDINYAKRTLPVSKCLTLTIQDAVDATVAKDIKTIQRPKGLHHVLTSVLQTRFSGWVRDTLQEKKRAQRHYQPQLHHKSPRPIIVKY